MLHKPVLFCFLFLFPAVIFAQSLSYSTYTIKDGLAGNQVYSIKQDNEGFIWFGTETGASRFDGSTFRNYTIRDGLPDNAILRVFPDSRGRVWLIPFNKSICYFYKGKIYNQKNDPVLKDIIFKYSITNITETRDSSIILFGHSEILELKPDGRLISHPLPGNNTYEFSKASEYLKGPEIFFSLANRLYKYNNGDIQYIRKITLNEIEFWSFSNTLNYWVSTKLNSLHIELPEKNLHYDIPFPSINNINAISDSIIAINTIKGTFIFNLISRQIRSRFLPDHNTSNWFKDSEGNNWLATTKGAVIRIHSENFRSFSTLPNKEPLPVYCMYKDGNKILLGSDRKIWQLNSNMTLTPLTFGHTLNKAVSFITKNKGKYYFGVGSVLYSGSPDQGFISTKLYAAAKKVAFKTNGTVYVSTSYGLMNMKQLPDNFHTLSYRGRTTSVFILNDTCWLGTMNGLHSLINDSIPQSMGPLSPQLQDRISDINADQNGNIWVATASMGLVAIKNNKVTYQLNTNNGLSSDVIHCITPDPDGSLWVGTDKGLDHISFSGVKPQITSTYASEGLISGFVNAIVLSNDTVFVGTPEGLSFFNKKSPQSYSECKLVLEDIFSSGKKLDSLPIPEMYYGKHALSIHFTAISLKSGGNIIYHYRLKGYDSAWKTTAQSSLEFISLPAGSYELELYATNKFNVKSNTIQLNWTVIPHFWQTSWFIILAMLATILLTLYLVNRMNNKKMNRKIQEHRTEQRFLELEQKALQARMNPHFIFNCLHAIQEFMLDKDILSANRYLNSFARLIRQTLDHSQRTLITLTEEAEYLNTYLHLEKMRFGNKFDFEISIDEALNPANIYIPCMMLQPIAENAIRHGIQHRSTPGGRVEVRFTRTGQFVNCTIRDNGPGIAKVQSLKSEKHIEYQSRGMQITKDRIEMLNKRLASSIRFSIKEIIENDAIAGTEINLQLPMITDPNFIAI